ncbi:hypothetical protein BDB01DRAFT_848046 [Pilobolus umbonatus]|nr:hypothetical protein BDB01DRAFT_848046 [Pilobolus umbonatus]
MNTTTTTSTPRACTGYPPRFEHSICVTYDTCREHGAQRFEESNDNRRRSRATLLPANYISQLNRYELLDIGLLDYVYADCEQHWKGELVHQTPYSGTHSNLFDDVSGQGRKFKDNIRRYNAAFAFTFGQLLPLTDTLLSYAQLYIIDPTYAASLRFVNNNQQLDKCIMDNLTNMLHEYNPHVALYRLDNEFLSSHTGNNGEAPPSMTIEQIGGSDVRTENLPTTEVAVVLPNERTEASFGDIGLCLRNDSQFIFTSISQSHALYMPLHFTLLFGWNGGCS